MNAYTLTESLHVKGSAQQTVSWGKTRSTKRAREKAIDVIEASGLFDPLWYKAGLSRQELQQTSNLIEHYVTVGSECGMQPNPLFCPTFYHNKYPDVAEQEWEPFHHFLTYGIAEQRNPHLLFSTETYKQRAECVLGDTFENPLLHFLTVGYKIGISPHSLFDTCFYESQKKKEGFRSGNFKTKSSFSNSLIEFLEFGALYNVSPHPLFHIRYYKGLTPELIGTATNPLMHFLEFGYGNRSNPHPLFNSDFYLWMNPDVHQAHHNPLMHYLDYGEKELRDPSPFFCTQFYVERYLKNKSAAGALEYFASEGWRKCQNPSPWINMAHAFEDHPKENLDEDFPVEFFGRMILERPNSAISPELYFAFKEIEKGTNEPLKIYLSLSRRQHIRTENHSNKPEQGLVKGLAYYAPLSVVSGLGEACRGYTRAMKHANIICHTIPTEVPSYQKQISVPRSYARKDWPVALAHVNADSIFPFFNTNQGKSFLEHSYRIGFWAWELPSFQSEWHANLASYDEIWVPSTFCQEAVASATNITVRRVPHVVEQQSSTPNSLETRQKFRSQWNIPSHKFVFYYIFDASSYVERKNPFALIEAFRDAFVEEQDAHLLLKISYGSVNKQFTHRLKKLLASFPTNSFTIIAEVLSRPELDALVIASDCCVSPHRSEGFGLTVAEALLFGKPVIATDFSGTTDFLTSKTGYPVAYKLIEIERDIGPYKRGNIWANPLHEALTEAMRSVFLHREAALKKAQEGTKWVQQFLSTEAIGALIREFI